MIVRHNYSKYELSLIDGLRFYVRKSWFPIRRMLRFYKRLFVMARTWIVLLAIFLVLYLAVQSVLLRDGLMSPDGVITDLVSLLLTSFVLVFMRDVMASERRRNLKLKRQLTILEKTREGTFSAVCLLTCSFGLAEPKYSDWRDWSQLAEYLRRLPSEAIATCNDIDSLYEALMRLYELANKVESWYIEDAIVDASPISEDRSLMYYTDSIRGAISRMMRKLDGAEPLTAQVTDIHSLVSEAFIMTEVLGRPWRYGNDQAKKRLLQKFLNEHGVEIH